MSQTRSIPSHGKRRQATLARETAQALRKTVLEALLRAGLAAGSDHAPLRLARAAVATMPAQLAAAQATDPSTQRELAASYQRCLQAYREMAHAQQPDTTDDDIGAAVAFFVAVNLHALHGVDVGTEVMVPLESQLRGVTRRASNWDTAPLAERQGFFERIAILAVVVSGSRASAAAQGPAAVANVRRTARQYLQQLLGLNPDLLTLEPAGLAARSRNAAASPGAVAQAA